ncbi:hypothetical protein [Streptomyces sp. NPDC053427]|uniref:hypothetical protein n=1 Tax=Streptomyces sp. NPDC053427 TaxID=3365701 RepID=UPI0037CDA275
MIDDGGYGQIAKPLQRRRKRPPPRRTPHGGAPRASRASTHSLEEAGHHVTWPAMHGDTFAPGATELSVREYGFGVSPTILGTSIVSTTGPGAKAGHVRTAQGT